MARGGWAPRCQGPRLVVSQSLLRNVTRLTLFVNLERWTVTAYSIGSVCFCMTNPFSGSFRLLGYRRLLRISPDAHTARIVRKTITPLPVPLIADEAEAKEQHIRYTEHYHGNGELYESIGNGIWFLAVSLSHVELLYRNLPTL